MRWIPMYLLSAVVATGNASLAQSDTLATGFISGTVTDHKTGETMPFATVRIVELKLYATTGENGYFAFKGIPPGRCTIAVDWVGYESYLNDKVKVRAGEITHEDIALRSARLPPLPKNVSTPDP